MKINLGALKFLYVRSSLFWDVMQRIFVVTDNSGQPIGPISKVQAVQKYS